MEAGEVSCWACKNVYLDITDGKREYKCFKHEISKTQNESNLATDCKDWNR